jgi:hypothetical protein
MVRSSFICECGKIVACSPICNDCLRELEKFRDYIKLQILFDWLFKGETL